MHKRTDPITQAYENLETEVNNRLKPISKWEAVNACLIALAIAAVVAMALISIKNQPKTMTKLDDTRFGVWLEKVVSL